MIIIFEKQKPNIRKYVKDFEHVCREKSNLVPYKTVWCYGVDFVDVNVKDQCVILSDLELINVNSVPFDMFEHMCIMRTE